MASSILPRNQTSPERVLRIVVGAALLSLVFVGPKSAWGLLGLIPFLAGLVGSCPLYTLFGIDRCRSARR